MTAPSDPGDADLALVDASASAKASSALHGMAGVISALAGVQFVTSGSFVDPALNAVPWSLIALGVLEVPIALLVLRNHYPAALAGALLAPLLAIAALGWLVLGMSSGMMSFLAMSAVPAAGGAAVVAPFALASVRRGWAAKRRLAASGMELGL